MARSVRREASKSRTLVSVRLTLGPGTIESAITTETDASALLRTFTPVRVGQVGLSLPASPVLITVSRTP